MAYVLFELVCRMGIIRGNGAIRRRGTGTAGNRENRGRKTIDRKQKRTVSVFSQDVPCENG